MAINEMFLGILGSFTPGFCWCQTKDIDRNRIAT